MAKPRRKRPVPKKTRRRQKVVLSRQRMTKADCGNGEGHIHLFLDGSGARKIAKTVGVAAKKPGQHGATPVKWHITNDWTVAAKVDLVNFKPKYPFNAAGNKPTVSGGGGTGTLTRVVGPFSDRDTYSYQIQTTVGMASKPWDDPWLIVF